MGEISVVAHDPDRPALAEAAITEVRAVLGGSITELEHIGSTAVPGLAAKPIIDLMAAARTGLIQELTDAARAARGLDSVPVWES